MSSIPGPEDALVIDQLLRHLLDAGFCVAISLEMDGQYRAVGGPRLGSQQQNVTRFGRTMLDAVRRVYDDLTKRGLDLLNQAIQDAYVGPEVALTDVRENRHGADASQPGPAHPPGDSRHLEGGG